MTGIAQTATKPMPHHHLDVPELIERDPEHVEKLMWRATHVPREYYQRWKCPCCDVRAILAPDDWGHVWIMLTTTTRKDGELDLIRLDNAAEVHQLVDVWPTKADRFLLAAWMDVGLRDALLALFGS